MILVSLYFFKGSLVCGPCSENRQPVHKIGYNYISYIVSLDYTWFVVKNLRGKYTENFSDKSKYMKEKKIMVIFFKTFLECLENFLCLIPRRFPTKPRDIFNLI